MQLPFWPKQWKAARAPGHSGIQQSLSHTHLRGSRQGMGHCGHVAWRLFRAYFCSAGASGEWASCILLQLPFMAGRFWDCLLVIFFRHSHRDLKASLNDSILENHGPQYFSFLFFSRITELRIEPMSAEPWIKFISIWRANITRSWESPEKFGVYPPITLKLRHDSWPTWTKWLGLLEL